MTFSKIFVATLAMAISSPLAMAQAQEPATEVAAETNETITAKVNGMVCDFCARAVNKVFKKNDAVETVDVDLDTGEIIIALKDGGELADEEVERLVKKSGYALVSIERGIS